jgi:hypothetical protein
MQSLAGLGRGTIVALAHEFRAPLFALGVALALRLAGVALKRDWLVALACGGGLLAGWWVLTGHGFSADALLAPHSAAGRLILVALAGALVALASAMALAGRGLMPVVLALFTGWWLSGGPHSLAGLERTWPVLTCVALVVWAACRLLEDGDFWRALAAALALCVSLFAVGAGPFWLLLALVPAASLVALAPGGRMPTGALLPAAAGMMAAGSAAVLVAGRLPHEGIGRIDIAAAAPLLVLWLGPRLGRAAPPVASLLAALIAVALATVAGRVLAYS